MVAANGPDPDAAFRVLLTQFGSGSWASASWSPPEVILHSRFPPSGDRLQP